MKDKQRSYLTSAAILAAGGIFAKLLGIAFKSPLASIIGDYGLGLYGYPYPLYTTFLAISVAGLPIAVSKMIAERVSLGNYRGAYKVFRVSFIALLVTPSVSENSIMFLKTITLSFSNIPFIHRSSSILLNIHNSNYVHLPNIYISFDYSTLSKELQQPKSPQICWKKSLFYIAKHR